VINYSFQQTQPAKEEALTLGEVKKWLRIDDDLTDDDDLVNGLIGVVARYTEAIKGVCLTTQKWNMYLDSFPCDEIKITKRPVVSVDAVKYLDSTGAQQTLEIFSYQTNLTSFVPKIRPAWGYYWPYGRCGYKAIQIEITAGYGAAAKVPAQVKAAMCLAIGHFYENRENSVVKDYELLEMPLGYHALMSAEAIVHV